MLGGCSNMREEAKKNRPSTVEVWKFIEQESAQAGLDPYFVFAIAQAESSLDPSAESANGFARGLMQMSEGAWQTVSDKDWDHAWQWQENVRMGIAYLVHLRGLLEKARAFSYPALAASYRFGPGAVKRQNYSVSSFLPRVKNRVYRQLLSGNLRPVPAPT